MKTKFNNLNASFKKSLLLTATFFALVSCSSDDSQEDTSTDVLEVITADFVTQMLTEESSNVWTVFSGKFIDNGETFDVNCTNFAQLVFTFNDDGTFVEEINLSDGSSDTCDTVFSESGQFEVVEIDNSDNLQITFPTDEEFERASLFYDTTDELVFETTFVDGREAVFIYSN